MNLFSKIQLEGLSTYNFHFTKYTIEDHVMTIVLNRPEKRNALHPQMMQEIAFLMNYAHEDSSIWVVVIRAEGPVFCAGADLKAMAGMIEPHQSTVPTTEQDVLMVNLFRAINKPCIAVVHADVFAGGFFFLAGCHIVLTSSSAKFSLPEVRRGLFPFQVMEALCDVMPRRKVLDWCMRGYTLNAQEAEINGLVTDVVLPHQLHSALYKIIGELKKGSPTAIRYGLQAYENIKLKKDHQQQYLYDLLQKTIQSPDGQEGLAAFREKREPQWNT